MLPFANIANERLHAFWQLHTKDTLSDRGDITFWKVLCAGPLRILVAGHLSRRMTLGCKSKVQRHSREVVEPESRACLGSLKL
jgi:hypothetical protein